MMQKQIPVLTHPLLVLLERVELVDKLVLLCPSGFGGQERFPVMEGARHGNYRGLVESTFYDRRRASPRIAEYYEQKFACKAWRKAWRWRFSAPSQPR